MDFLSLCHEFLNVGGSRSNTRHVGSGSSQSQIDSFSQPSSNTLSSTTPTDSEGAVSIPFEEEPPPPPIATRPERTKSIVSKYIFNFQGY